MAVMEETPHNEPQRAQKGFVRIVLTGIIGVAIATSVAALVGHFLFGEPFDRASNLKIGIPIGAVIAALQWQRETQPSQHNKN
jgi:hypothetical protein